MFNKRFVFYFNQDDSTEKQTEQADQKKQETSDANMAEAMPLNAEAAEQAEKYCSEIESNMDQQLSTLGEADSTPFKPPVKEDGESDDDWAKKNEEYNKKSEAYNAEIAKLKSSMITSMKAEGNSKVVDYSLTQMKVDPGEVGKMSSTTSASLKDFAKKIYVNYKIAGVPDGGWGVAENLSDVPQYVADGELDLGKFKRRSEVLKKAVTATNTKVAELKQKYA